MVTRLAQSIVDFNFAFEKAEYQIYEFDNYSFKLGVRYRFREMGYRKTISGVAECYKISSSKDLQINPSSPKRIGISEFNDLKICKLATDADGNWQQHSNFQIYLNEAQRRGLDCSVNTKNGKILKQTDSLSSVSDAVVCYKAKVYLDPRSMAISNEGVDKYLDYAIEMKRRKLFCSQEGAKALVPAFLPYYYQKRLCFFATNEVKDNENPTKTWDNSKEYKPHVIEANRRGLSCGVKKSTATQVASTTIPSSNSVYNAELTAAQRKAERLEAELAALKAERQQQQQTISNDTRVPIIDQLSANTSGKQGIVTGRVRDNTGIAEVTVDGTVVQVGSNGRFEHRTFIPADGKQVLIEATDLAGLTSQKQLRLSRNAAIQSASISFDSLNPLGKIVAKNRDALALIVGVETYEQTPAPAIYADSDAKMFRDYASEKLGIPDNRIETLINDGAELTDMLLSVKNWLARSVKQDRTDVYVFFAGHGLASEDGERMYLLPYDGSPQLLDRTAILRDELFSDIASANPRSVTVFLDTCYSGTTRGTDMLVASRPIAIRAKQQNIPDGFTVFTAAGGDQTAKPLEEAKHGMFSYFLMKGMEGDADSNRDNQITAAELHEYVEQNVVQQSGGSQVPELQGDAERVLVRFQ